MNKLGLKFIEQCSNIAKTCGKTDLLSKPAITAVTEEGKYTASLTEDIVQLGQTKFQKLFSAPETDLINQIKGGQIENAKVIDKNGNLANNIKFIGDKYSVRISPECAFNDGVIDTFIDSTYIHNHPLNAPLSSNDLYQMAILKIKKMVACTADGGYSIMQRNKPISEMDYNAFIKAAESLNSEEIRQMKALSKIRGITDLQRMEMLNQWRYERFNAFADEFGLEFQNNINTINNKINPDCNIFSLNPIQRLVDNIIIKYRKIFD